MMAQGVTGSIGGTYPLSEARRAMRTWRQAGQAAFCSFQTRQLTFCCAGHEPVERKDGHDQAAKTRTCRQADGAELFAEQERCRDDADDGHEQGEWRDLRCG